MLYLPTPDEVAAAGADPGSRDGEFDCRSPLTMPGPVYTLVSGTGMTGRMFAREGIAYDEQGREFVYRQPRDVEQLRALVRAQGVEVNGCYRFDGLQRWTAASAWAWWQHVDVVLGFLESQLQRDLLREVRTGLQAYLDLLSAPEAAAYAERLVEHLAARA